MAFGCFEFAAVYGLRLLMSLRLFMAYGVYEPAAVDEPAAVYGLRLFRYIFSDGSCNF
jgi:hypothetical protein